MCRWKLKKYFKRVEQFEEQKVQLRLGVAYMLNLQMIDMMFKFQISEPADVWLGTLCDPILQ